MENFKNYIKKMLNNEKINGLNLSLYDIKCCIDVYNSIAKKQKLLEYKDIMNLSYLKRIKVKNLNYLKLTQLYLLIELLRKNNINTERIHLRNTILKYSEF